MGVIDRPSRPPRTGRSAALVAGGILLSRLAGLIRQRVFAHYFGLENDAADAFTAAVRIPNFLQNLFGEGALSASFIPVYAALLARGDRREADRVAGAVASILALLVATLVLAGVLATPLLIDAIAPGFHGAKRQLTIEIVRVLFPGTGLLVMSAWCLGVLNSHHRFLLSYASPVVWNAAMIATLIALGTRETLPDLAVTLAWGSVVGSALQFAVQLPVVFRVAPDLGFSIDTVSDHVRTIGRNFTPAFVSRGVVQVSAYIDSLLASLLPTGAVTGLGNAQLLYTLPVSLFGMSVSAAELPAMSGAIGADIAGVETLRKRLDAGLRQIAFFVVPSAMAFFALGDIVAATVLQTGRFRHSDAVYVWGILAGSAVGLLASTLGRLYASAFYALRDTRTPLRCAVVRVVLTTVLGYFFAIPFPRAAGIPPVWGAAGLTMSAGMAGWIEMLMLRRLLNRRVGRTGLASEYLAKLWLAAVAGAGVGWILKVAIPTTNPVLTGALVLLPYGVTFFLVAIALRIPEASGALLRVRRPRSR
ncbi:MAG: murein biosynthesis integral membrane protein MurJ [Blastocatellia bacterium]|nr:MAG: murein biosynthesis integral membrane protein MurJ [Blastocatellia bacterium]